MESSHNRDSSRDATSGATQEDSISSSPHYGRFELWVCLAVGAMVVLGASVDAFQHSAKNPRSPTIAAGIGFSAITMVMALLFATLMFRAMTKKQGEHRAWFLDLEKPIGPAAELEVIVTCMIISAVNLALLHWENKEAADGWGLVKNANLYYGSWTSFFSSGGLLYVFLREYRDVDLIHLIRSGGPRCIEWTLLCLSSLIMMGSAINTFVSSHCRSGDPVLPELLLARYPSLDAEVYCSRTALALGLATTIAFVCIMILCELIYVDDYEKEALLESEMLFASTSCLSLVISMGYITSMAGPASMIGNMYYSGWVCFTVSCLLVISCLSELAQRKKSRMASTGRPRNDVY